MTLSRAHTSDKDTDISKLLLLNKFCKNLEILWKTTNSVARLDILDILWKTDCYRLPPKSSGFFCGSCATIPLKFAKSVE